MSKLKVGEVVQKDGRTYKVIDVVATGPVLTLVTDAETVKEEPKNEEKPEAPKRGRRAKEEK